MHLLLLILKYGPLAFSALLPLVNPLGSALVMVGLVGFEPAEVYRQVARRVAVNTFLLLAAVDVAGAAILHFFGLSLPVVQVAGGSVITAMGWRLLNQGPSTETTPAQNQDRDSLASRFFYPYTFPVTAGPGCIVLMLTLSAHAQKRTFFDTAAAHVGLWIGVAALCVLVYLAYRSAPRLTSVIRRHTVEGVLRIMAFILVCIGVQIAWNGAEGLLRPLLR